MKKQVLLISQDALAHVGVLGMKWGVRRAQKKAYSNAKKQEYSRFQSELKKAGVKATQNDVINIAAKHDARMKQIKADFESANGPKMPFGEKVARAYGLKKNSKGQWVSTPEAHAKAAATGIALGFASFFLEMKVRDFVGSRGDIYNAAYTAWLRNG